MSFQSTNILIVSLLVLSFLFGNLTREQNLNLISMTCFSFIFKPDLLYRKSLSASVAVVRTVCLLAPELLALVVEESERMPEMSHLQAGPLGLHDDNSDGIIGTTLLLHAETGPQRLKTTSWSPTPSRTNTHTGTHANECMFEYVYKGDGRVG